MGVNHLLCCGWRRGCFLGLGSYGSNSCSGILTTAFLGLSSLAPSSVDPFSPHRTFKKKPFYLDFHSVKQRKFQIQFIQSSYLHAFDATHSSPTIVGCIHCGPLLPRHPIVIVRVLGSDTQFTQNSLNSPFTSSACSSVSTHSSEHNPFVMSQKTKGVGFTLGGNLNNRFQTCGRHNKVSGSAGCYH